MRGVFGEILKKKNLIFLILPFFAILDIINAIFWKVLVLEARTF